MSGNTVFLFAFCVLPQCAFATGQQSDDVSAVQIGSWVATDAGAGNEFATLYDEYQKMDAAKELKDDEYYGSDYDDSSADESNATHHAGLSRPEYDDTNPKFQKLGNKILNYQTGQWGKRQGGGGRGGRQKNGLGLSLIIKNKRARKRCGNYHHMQCLLDAMEKTCSPPFDGKKTWDPSALLSETGAENVWTCCCPEPYKACHETEANPQCLALLERNVRPFLLGQTHDRFSLEVEEEDLMREALQRVRSGMRIAGGPDCLSLASSEPFTGCGFQQTPRVLRTLGSKHLFCEMITWQWEELGDGDPQEFEDNDCPFKQQDGASPSEGGSRKGGKITKVGATFNVKGGRKALRNSLGGGNGKGGGKGASPQVSRQLNELR